VKIVPLWVKESKNHISPEKARQHLGLPINKIVFLHFGALHWGKDIETVFAAFKGISNAILVFAGKIMFSVAQALNIENLINRYELQGKVIFIDSYIPEEDKKYYFAAADAIILSYRRKFLSTASLLFEAARFRVPVIASDNGELGETVRKYNLGLVFKAQDPSSLKESLIRFCNLGYDEKKVFRENCEKFSRYFSIANWVQKHTEIFQSLCASVK
jgi:glycosyltransferase involved in cell wall biosynthesis